MRSNQIDLLFVIRDTCSTCQAHHQKQANNQSGNSRLCNNIINIEVYKKYEWCADVIPSSIRDEIPTQSLSSISKTLKETIKEAKDTANEAAESAKEAGEAIKDAAPSLNWERILQQSECVSKQTVSEIVVRSCLLHACLAYNLSKSEFQILFV